MLTFGYVIVAYLVKLVVSDKWFFFFFSQLLVISNIGLCSNAYQCYHTIKKKLKKEDSIFELIK